MRTLTSCSYARSTILLTRDGGTRCSSTGTCRVSKNEVYNDVTSCEAERRLLLTENSVVDTCTHTHIYILARKCSECHPATVRDYKSNRTPPGLLIQNTMITFNPPASSRRVRDLKRSSTHLSLGKTPLYISASLIGI